MQDRLAFPPFSAYDLYPGIGSYGSRDHEDPGMERELRHACEEGSQVAAKREPCARTCDNAADQALYQAALLLRHANFEIVAEQDHDERANEHAPHDPAVRTLECRALHLYQFEVSPIGNIDAEQLEDMSSKARKLAGDGPYRVGNAEVQRAEYACDADRNVRAPVVGE